MGDFCRITVPAGLPESEFVQIEILQLRKLKLVKSGLLLNFVEMKVKLGCQKRT